MNINCTRKGSMLLAATAALALFGLDFARATPVTFTQQNVPDFSQYEVVGWRNYCAPTAGTNVIYYFSQGGYAALRQNQPLGPTGGQGTQADVGASTNIGNNQAPPAPVNPVNMANLMGTTAAKGTTVNNMLTGLDNYLEGQDGVAGNVTWTTSLLLSAIPAQGGVGGAVFWSTLQQAVSNGDGVLLAVGWQQGAPNGYDTPDNYFYDANPENPMGHAFTMVGYDVSNVNPALHTLSVLDPANNPLGNAGTEVHVWPALVADSYAVTVNPGDLSIVVGGVTGTVYAAVITSPIPEPGTAALAISGLLALGAAFALRKRRH
jgi:hypothetical protein